MAAAPPLGLTIAGQIASLATALVGVRRLLQLPKSAEASAAVPPVVTAKVKAEPSEGIGAP